MNRDPESISLALATLHWQSLLVFAAHAGDEQLGAGGLLALPRVEAARISVSVPERAAGLVGLEYGEVLVGQVAAALDALDADLVLAPSPFEPDADRYALSLSVIEAMRRRGGAARLALYEIGAPGRPNLRIEIGAVFADKCSALLALDLPADERRVTELNRYRARGLPEAAAAEAFEVVTAAELAEGRTALFASEAARGRAAGRIGDPRRDAPLVSIIVRSMDRPSLAEALDAVALQTWPNLELLVVNARGGVHHDPGPACGRFPLRLLNQGGAALPRAAAANAGITAATGEWLLFLDDDDLIDPDHIDRLRHGLQADPGCRVAYAGVRLRRRDGSEAGVLDEPFDATRLWLANYLPIHAVMFARAALDGARFDESLAVYEDWDFWRQLAERERFLHVPGVSATYRLVGDSGLSERADEALAQKARLRFYAKWRERLDPALIERIAAAAELARVQAQEARAHAARVGDDLHAARGEASALRTRLLAAEAAQREAQQAHDRLAAEFGLLAQAHARREAEHAAERATDRGAALQAQQALRSELAEGAVQRAESERWQHELLAQITAAKAGYDELSRLHHALTLSWSWRLTAPLRGVRARLNRPALRRTASALAWRAIRLAPLSNETRQRTKARLAAHPLGIRLLRLLATPAAAATTSDAAPVLDKEAVRRAAETELDALLAGDERVVFSGVPDAAPPRVSVVVVLYNQAGLSALCLRALAASRGVSFETIVVDNASSDRVPRLLERLDGVTVVRHDDNLGFLRAVNAAADLARGEHLLLLNNDAVVEPETLARAVARLDAEPQAGAVGGPILLWDGRLQEAGSIVWRDGSCLGYGRGDDPDAPPYRYVREVDYCSGALLMIRRALFERLGRFDEAFAPAYYEESDFCARLWQAGHSVVCDPAVRVKHFEFASDTGSGRAIALQTAHRALFVERHPEFLAARPAPSADAVLAARQRLPAGAKRVLFIDDRVPFPAMGQGYPRACDFVAAIVHAGHFVSHYPLQFPDDGWDAIAGVLPERVEVMRGHGLAGFAAFMASRAGFYDTVLVSRPHNMQVLQALRDRQPALFDGLTVVYDAEALFSLRDIEKARLLGAPLAPAQAERRVADELALSSGADRVVAVSEAEAAHYRDAGRAQVHVLGHAVEAQPVPPGVEGRHGFLFVGGVPVADTPNGDALLWFVREVWPRIVAVQGAAARLHIVGELKAPEVQALASDTVRLHGSADRLAPCFDAARVFVVPTRYAAGIPHKAHEAAAHGLPMVVTPLIAGQLGWSEELQVADGAEAFAAACLQLHDDDALWQRLQQGALRAVQRDCSPAAFEVAVRQIIGPPLPPR